MLVHSEKENKFSFSSFTELNISIMLPDFNRKQKRDPKRQILIMLGGFLVLFIVLVLAIADIKIYQKKQKYISQIEELKNKIQELEDRKISLKKGIENSNNQDYIEKVAREELDLQKPGENVVSFIRSNDNQPEQANNNFLQSWFTNTEKLFSSMLDWFK